MGYKLPVTLVTIVLIVTTYIFWSDTTEQHKNSVSEPSPSFEPMQSASKIADSAEISAPDNLTQQLRSTSLDGTRIDAPGIGGDIWLKPGLVFYFDYFLSLRGEKPQTTINQLIDQDVRSRFSAAAAPKVYDLFQRYLAYQNALAERDGQVDDLDDFRREYFSALEADVLFNQYQQQLSRPSKAAKQHRQWQTYQQRVKQSPNDKVAITTEIFGEVAATRMQALEQQRNEWQQRLDYFELQFLQLQRAQGLADNDKQRAVTDLLQHEFSETEQRRVKALMRLRGHALK
ncbi:Lipase chaperone [BD1-7 clade bacterium]|uniref:Lipase chaperone n=1 Tax=BD1-7 clade bacterium TaxID=2029982 RepID=A0A5S9PE71_9GAMM|nr:Lipase chaperone [BD1-7 clade bacterium]CAA0102115.1 Lipase chaperone [BD1-7 clade bacterium]